jgi:hypothetical protein
VAILYFDADPSDETQDVREGSVLLPWLCGVNGNPVL